MARATVRISNELWAEVTQLPQVRAELMRQARIIAATAQAISNAEQVDNTITVEEGIRPKGRAFARVTSSNADDSEFGTEEFKRVRALGRAAGIKAT